MPEQALSNTLLFFSPSSLCGVDQPTGDIQEQIYRGAMLSPSSKEPAGSSKHVVYGTREGRVAQMVQPIPAVLTGKPPQTTIAEPSVFFNFF